MPVARSAGPALAAPGGELGDLLLVEVRARHVVDLFEARRPDRAIACILDERQLGPLVDKDPEWRETPHPG
jgi:hypothetical protein